MIKHACQPQACKEFFKEVKETVTTGREIGYLDQETGVVHHGPPHAQDEGENAGRTIDVEEVDSPTLATPEPARTRSRSRPRIVRE